MGCTYLQVNFVMLRLLTKSDLVVAANKIGSQGTKAAP